MTWRISKAEKDNLVKAYQIIYEDDLKGKPDPKEFKTPKSQKTRIAEKHVGLTIMRVAAKDDNVWVLPVGRNYPFPKTISAEEDNTNNDGKNNPKYIAVTGDEVSIPNGTIGTSRLEGVLIYNWKTGGMVIINFGISQFTYHHSNEECLNKYASDNIFRDPSVLLKTNLVSQALQDLDDPIHTQLYEPFRRECYTQASQSMSLTVEEMSAGHRRLRADRLDQNPISIGCRIENTMLRFDTIPVLPETNAVKIEFTEKPEYYFTIDAAALKPNLIPPKKLDPTPTNLPLQATKQEAAPKPAEPNPNAPPQNAPQLSSSSPFYHKDKSATQTAAAIVQQPEVPKITQQPKEAGGVCIGRFDL